MALDEDKVNADVKYDSIWVLTTNTKLKAREVALKYKELMDGGTYLPRYEVSN